MVPLKNDGTFGDVAIGTVAADDTVTQSGGDLEMSEDMMPPSVGRFADGAVFSRTSMGVTDTVYVYETRSAPGPLAWDMQYPEDFTATDAISSIAEAASTPVGSQSFNVLTFGTDVTTISMRFESDMFPSGVAQTYTYLTDTDYDSLPTSGPNARGPAQIRRRMFDGMFHGISGTYSCAEGGDCTATTNNRGELITLSAGWTFRPNNLAEGLTGHMVQGVVNDTDYLTFGYWVQKDEDDTGDVTIGVSTFASGSDTLADADIAALVNLVGTADYNGKAVGKFALKTLAPDGAAIITDGGTFTADANLKAYFGGNAISFNDRFTISGTIDDFRNDDGDVIDSNWSVALSKADFTSNPGTDPAADKTTTQATFTGITSAGGPSGAWGGSFYGPSDDAPAADANQDEYPSSVAGEFDAHFLNGHALGAFGATR